MGTGSTAITAMMTGAMAITMTEGTRADSRAPDGS
jgi:hypothetical protein